MVKASDFSPSKGAPSKKLRLDEDAMDETGGLAPPPPPPPFADGDHGGTSLATVMVPDAGEPRSSFDGSPVTSPGTQATPVTGQVTLDAIGKLMEQKFSAKLDPIQTSIDKMMLDLNMFKDSVRKKLNTMGLRITSVEKEHSTHITQKFRAPAPVQRIEAQPSLIKHQRLKWTSAKPGCWQHSWNGHF